MISLHDVTKTLGNRLVVDHVSLSVEPGTTHVLLGASGSGKSTILRLILGLLSPDTGEIVIDGLSLRMRARGDLARRIGYVVQEGALYPHLTAARNVTLPARSQGWAESRIVERLGTLADLAGLEQTLLERYPAQLSGGQRQRVGLMRALMLDPAALLLDEPLAALDPITRADLQHQLSGLFRSLRKTVVLVTHDVREAFFFGSSITLLRNGRIVQQGTFADLARKPVEPFVSEFLRAQAPPPDMMRDLQDG
jgi:osmoprotectant transport system ATP-binding protein